MKSSNRRKFLFAGLSFTGLVAALPFLKKPVEKKQSIKFLTQEGKLVEIDVDKIPSNKQAATKKDIQGWIKKSKL
jgi:hypothetical protein